MKVIVRPETAADGEEIRNVNRRAFGRDAESQLVDALREGGYARISLVAVADGRVVGHILFNDLSIVTAAGVVPALALAPMAVLPEYQRQGIGSELVRQGLDLCRAEGHHIVIVLGHPEFYRRFGFSAEKTRGLDAPFSGEAFMAAELTDGALHAVAGQLEYPPPFFDL